jgi:hypothetical protein
MSTVRKTRSDCTLAVDRAIIHSLRDEEYNKALVDLLK